MGKGLMQMFRRRGRSVDMDDYYARQEKRGFVGSRQKMDPVPVAPPVGYKKQPSMVEIIREQVRNARLAAELDAQGMETFEEADDFEIDDEPPLPRSQYEAIFEPPIVEEKEVVKKPKEKEVVKKPKEEAPKEEPTASDQS